jgi:protein-arginine kinase activator protein McsA
MTAPSILLRLPTELQLLLVSHLVFPDTAHLRATCSTFASLIPAQLSDYKTLLDAEDGAWARKRNRLTCVFCARMRPSTCFTDAQKAGRRDWRCCHDCAISYADGYTYRVYYDISSTLPRHAHRTNFSPVRKPQVNGKEKAICKNCHNAFGQWGKLPADRGVCIGCAVENFEQEELGIMQLEGYMKDLNKACGRDVLWWPMEWSEMVVVRGELTWEECGLYGCFCDYCTDEQELPRWRDGRRGVQVRARTE